MYPKGTDHPHFAFSLRHKEEMSSRKFYLDEITPDRYALYHLFDIDDLTEDSNTLLQSLLFHSIHLSGFAKDLPTGGVSLWISCKFAGAAYGGNPAVPDSFNIDRLFLVPRG